MNTGLGDVRVQEIKFLADTASDIPDADLERLNIDMVYVPIAVDGKGFYERKSFDFDEFYRVLNHAREIPVTSRIPQAAYMEQYEKVYAQGYKHLVNVTINSKGSGTHSSAEMAVKQFYEENPSAKEDFKIHVIDSKTYSVGYGYPVMMAAEMAENNEDIDVILDYLNDWFARLDVYLGCYTLKYAQKSGRIHFATAFVGEVLGMRPIIRLVDGDTETVAKVRGDKNVGVGLIKQYKSLGLTDKDEVLIVCGEDREVAEELQQLFKKERKTPVPIYQAGACIAINVGPKLLAILCKSHKREA